jgi:NADH-quinone oxidoreductase subunit G
MAKITLDGREIEVRDGSTILEAANRHGAEVPHYCYHPGLSISGNCRMCLVEVEGMPKLVIGCYTQVKDGMVVNTKVDKVKQAQQSVMEFLLVNHPLDCPICDQAGECKLQDYSFEYGTGKSRYVEPKQTGNKAVDIGKHVMLDQERCIQCSRCTRFCDEITETSELDFFQRGSKTAIGLHPGVRLDNDYSGNVVDICPVGALTSKEFRFQTRVWYLQQTPTVCAGCSRGCNVVAATGKQNKLFTSPGQFDDRIKRVVPRHNEAVNGYWICDEGRLSHERLQAADRLSQPMAGEAVLEWDTAVATMAEALGSGRVGAVFSPRLTSEDLFAWSLLLKKLNGARFGALAIRRGVDDNLLIRANKGANALGASRIFGGAEAEDVWSAVDRGQIDTLLVVADPLDPDDIPTLDAGRRAGVKTLLTAGPFLAGAMKQADVVVPTTSWGEEDGHYVNFEGRLQRVARAHKPKGFGRPGWRLAADIAKAAGIAFPAWKTSRAVFLSLGEAHESFDVDPDSVGLLGTEAAACCKA